MSTDNAAGTATNRCCVCMKPKRVLSRNDAGELRNVKVAHLATWTLEV
jgi:hypothetical protein